MKKQFILAVMLVFILTALKAQWEIFETPEFNDPGGSCGGFSYKGRIASESNICWTALGSCSPGMGQYAVVQVYCSENGGSSWNSCSGASLDWSGAVLRIHFISPSVGYVHLLSVNPPGTYFSTELLTTDNFFGYTDNEYFDEPLLACLMIDYNHRYYLFQSGNFNKYEYGTTTFISALPFEVWTNWSAMPCMERTSNNNIFLACRSEQMVDLILKSQNGGYDWDTVYCPDGIINEIKFYNDSLGFAVGAAGILRTTDAGDSWQQLLSGTVQNIFSIDYRDEQTWIVGGASGIIFYTPDGGENWSLLSSPTGTIRHITFPEKNNTLMALDNNCIYKTSIDLLITATGQLSSPQSFNLIPNPANDQITVSVPAPLGNMLLEVFNTHGEIVMECRLETTETALNISAIPRGVYFLRLQSEKMVEVGKMVKK